MCKKGIGEQEPVIVALYMALVGPMLEYHINFHRKQMF